MLLIIDLTRVESTPFFAVFSCMSRNFAERAQTSAPAFSWGRRRHTRSCLRTASIGWDASKVGSTELPQAPEARGGSGRKPQAARHVAHQVVQTVMTSQGTLIAQHAAPGSAGSIACILNRE
jgi:hypothetical protein